MTISQMFVATLCLILATQQVTAVVNNAKSSSVEDSSNSSASSSDNNKASENSSSSSSTNVGDSIAAGSDQEANRREAPILQLTDSYGAPIAVGGGLDSYVPSGPSNPTLPIPVYGVPDAPSNNIVYPAPPPDIPPPLPSISTSYGTPLKTYGPPKPISTYGPPKNYLPPPSNNYGPPIPPPPKYGPPSKPHKPFIPPSFHGPKPPKHSYGPPPPRPHYGPPKPIFVPKPTYGPPKQTYGPPKPVYGAPTKPLFVPQNNYKAPAVTIVSIPQKDTYGPPPSNAYGPPAVHYGPPEPVPHGPPHPGAPAPPTPPDIKYDGWQPIPGLVSRPPSGSYGIPEGEPHSLGDLQFNSDFTPPPVGSEHGHGIGHGHGHGHNHGHGHSHGQSHGHGHGISSGSSLSTSSGHSLSSSYASSQGISDSYGAPLNAVTGSGGVDSTSGDAHHDDQSLSLALSAAGINSGQSHLSVIKSIGYELFPNSAGISHIGSGGGSYSFGGSDSYSAPPLSSYSPNGPYAAAHSYKSNGLSSSFGSFGSSHKTHNYHNSHSSHGSHGLSLSSSGIGLIPPSGVYGVPPSGQYGTPLISKPSSQYGAPLNALKINPPKHPVIFREPVPAGLIESIGQHTAHNDAHGIIESSHSSSFTSGPTYIPPPVPDITKPVKEEEPPAPTTLYSLPNPSSSISFQNLAHGSSTAGLSFNTQEFNLGGAHASALTSYTAPLGSVDGSYSLPVHSGEGFTVSVDNAQPAGVTVGLDNSHPPLTIDLTSGHGASSIGSSFSNSYNYQNVQHDCSLHKSQPLPSLSYGVPSANSYTASLSSLTTNIGGGYQGSSPSLSYGVPDLHTAHSQTVTTGTSANSIESDTQGKSYGKSLAESFAPGSELIKSESIDINNIPIQGALGSYTLQIQSADGLNGPGPSTGQVPHAQVLNDGLLQSILAAIEQPQQKDANILGQPLLQLQSAPQSYGSPSGLGVEQQDAEAQHSVTNAVVVSPPATEASVSTTNATSSTQEPEADTDAPLRLIDNNEIALYFSNNPPKSSQTNDANTSSEDESVRNGQQYGNYVSFKTPNTSYVYATKTDDKTSKSEDKQE